ncbi:MAG: transcription antitermination factor NusB [Actinomycetaceae bacterium]|nr:transcription antitermination factor NusB [Actinomycetaceae bacterium]
MAQKKNSKTARTTQRQRAMDILFEADERDIITSSDISSLLEERRTLSVSQVPIKEFGSSIVQAYIDNMMLINTVIDEASEDWSITRMNAVDRNILRGATAELLFLDTPRNAVISQWSSLAREFSTERSVGFVMGVLNRIADKNNK